MCVVELIEDLDDVVVVVARDTFFLSMVVVCETLVDLVFELVCVSLFSLHSLQKKVCVRFLIGIEIRKKEKQLN